MKTIPLAALVASVLACPTLAQTPSPPPNQERTAPTANPQQPKPSPAETVRCEDHPKSELNDVARSACEDRQKKK
jgi:hypothetical protein